MFCQKLCKRLNAWAGALSWWSCQSPVAHSCSLLNHPNSFLGGMFKLNVKFDADSLLHLLSYFECNSHTVHMLTQQHLLPPLTSTVRWSLFTHAHSSPPSLAARLHWCHANCSSYVNNGWTFSVQTSYCWWSANKMHWNYSEIFETGFIRRDFKVYKVYVQTPNTLEQLNF